MYSGTLYSGHPKIRENSINRTVTLRHPMHPVCVHEIRLLHYSNASSFCPKGVWIREVPLFTALCVAIIP